MRALFNLINECCRPENLILGVSAVLVRRQHSVGVRSQAILTVQWRQDTSKAFSQLLCEPLQRSLIK